MITVRPAKERGFVDMGWLKSRHTFSFGEYFDRSHMHFRNLRVINHDVFISGSGFDPHPHRDMEIVTYIIRGAVTHEDSLGHETTVKRGEIQRMSAGTGVVHSEYNKSNEDVEMLQIWILPGQHGIKPSYAQLNYLERAEKNVPALLVSPDGASESLSIHADVRIYRLEWESGKEILFQLPEERHSWVQVVRGSLKANGQLLREGDGAAFSHEKKIRFQGDTAGELLIFDLP